MGRMVERVARAIYEGEGLPWADVHEDDRAEALAAARAVIAAMREPTKRMADDGLKAIYACVRLEPIDNDEDDDLEGNAYQVPVEFETNPASNAWRSMIDSALE